MKKYKPLDAKKFKSSSAISSLHFKTTNDIKQLNRFVGQERALEALKFGVDIKSKGYNLYAMGPPGIGKYSLVTTILEAHAKKSPTPNDWCYIYNFQTPAKPIALQLPPGLGIVLQRDMKRFIEEIGSNIQSVFDSIHFRSQMKKISRRYKNITSEDLPNFSREKFEKEKKLISKLMKAVISPRIQELKKKYRKNTDVITYLSSVKKDMLEHANELIHADEKTNLFLFSGENVILTKYSVNLMVDNSQLKGAPIVFETNPNYSNLICRIEHASQQGNLVTNFTFIRPGCLHRANGGYLILEIRKLLKNMEAWEALKSALFAQKIKIEPIDRMSGSVKPISLEPTPIPMNIKVVLIGDRNTYYTLCQNDPDFNELFKVPVDFDEEIDRNEKNIQLYAKLIGTIVKRDKLMPLQANAVAAVIDYSSRLSDDAEKLSTHIRDIEDLVLEANYWAKQHKKKIIRHEDVHAAISAQIYRMDRSRELYQEDIERDFIIIHTQGKTVGQINCLSVRKIGTFSYGHPTRVTARVRPGKGKLIDIQREIKMAGPMHSKACLTIANYLASRFSSDALFSLSASLSFEQIYCWTDGDSASVGELCALLSALAEVPLYQSYAVTGSIDQYGKVQAVGGVNAKIEGFFDVCKARGLNGKQGILLPDINRKNLMLRDDIIKAAEQGKFNLYPIQKIEEAMELLTGVSYDVLVSKIEKKLKLFSKK